MENFILNPHWQLYFHHCTLYNYLSLKGLCWPIPPFEVIKSNIKNMKQVFFILTVHQCLNLPINIKFYQLG